MLTTNRTWPLIEVQAPTTHATRITKDHRREDEFRAALDCYITWYRKRNAPMICFSISCACSNHFINFPKFAGWIWPRGAIYNTPPLVPEPR